MYARITKLKLNPNRTVDLTFDNGAAGCYDLASWIKRGGMYEQLQQDAFYYRGRRKYSGRAVAWPGGQIELGADGLLADLSSIHQSEQSTRVALG